jgi:glycosyltransferase involved in cell wall biosynthesis
MKLVGFLQMYNEVEKGNLRRCLDNLKRYCDDIVIYDDGSTDNSIEVAKEYTKHIICGETNDFKNEILHKQELLDLALTLDPDWIFWLDCDEVLDNEGVEHIRYFCENPLIDGKAEGYIFPERTLWRSECYARKDYLGEGIFLRLWKVNPNLKFKSYYGLHGQQYPEGFNENYISLIPFSIIHYGYSTLWQIIDRWLTRNSLGVSIEGREKCIDETNMVCEHISHKNFPEECKPVYCMKPAPVDYNHFIDVFQRRKKHAVFSMHISPSDNYFTHKITRKAWVLEWVDKIGGNGIDIGAGSSKMSDDIYSIDRVGKGDTIPENGYVSEVDKKWDFMNGLPRQNLDFLIASHVIEHIPEKVLEETIKSWLYGLNPNGKFIIVMPNKHKYGYTPHHHVMFELDEFIDWIQKFPVNLIHVEKDRLHDSEFGIIVEKK